MNYYEILGVPHNANKELIVSAFRKLVKEYHPDRNKNPNASKIFVKIYEAYKILSDDNKRKLYDERYCRRLYCDSARQRGARLQGYRCI